MDELRKELGEVLHSTLHAALVDGVWSVFNRMEKEILSLQSQLGDAEDRADEDKWPYEKTRSAIDNFLDVVERPVGTQRFTVPQGNRTNRTNRTILGLYDAIGRNL